MAENIKKNDDVIVIDDGSKRVSIKNLDGEEIGVFRFKPTDFGIVNRYNETVERLKEIIEPLGDDQSDDAFQKAEKALYEACDYIFGGNMSEAFFGSVNPFSPVGGRFYCEQAIEVLGQYIGKQFDAEVKKIDKRVSKYTSKYHK